MLRFCRMCGEVRKNLAAAHCRKCGFKFDTPLDNSIGINVQSGRNIYLPQRELSTYVIGAQGMGKSQFLLQRIVSDIERNDTAAVCLDPHGDLARSILLYCPPEQAHRVIYFSPSEQRSRPFGLNPFEWHTEAEYGHRLSAVLRVFEHLFETDFSATPALHTALMTFIRTLFMAHKQYQTTFMHLFHLVHDTQEGNEWRRKLSELVKSDIVLSSQWESWSKKGSSWKIDTQSSYRRITNILHNEIVRPIITQPASSTCFNFQKVLGKKMILVANLAGIEGKEGWRLLGSLILGQLMAMGYQREDETTRVPCHIYVDEFDSFNPGICAEIISKLRKYKLCLSISHQSISQVSSEALAAALNCGNKVIFRVNAKEAKVLSGEFAKGAGISHNEVNSLRRYEAIVKYEQGDVLQQAHIRTQLLRTPPRPDIAREIFQRSLALYGRDPGSLQSIEGRQTDNSRTTKTIASEIDTNEWVEEE